MTNVSGKINLDNTVDIFKKIKKEDNPLIN